MAQDGKKLPLRWLTLAEIVGVAALVIAGLGYWDNHRERIQEDRERAAADREHRAEARVNALKQSFLMRADIAADGQVLRLQPVRESHVIQTQTLWFPKSVRQDSVETTGNPRIEAGWIARGLDRSNAPRRGRLPVGVLTVYVEDGQTRTDRSLYQLGYSRESRFLRADRLSLEGLSLARRDVPGDLQAAAGALWSAR